MKKTYGIIRTRKLILYPIVFLVLLNNILLPLPKVQAHPHVFINQRIDVVFDEKGVAGFKIYWKFDDMFASMIAEDHDINKNGKLESSESEMIRQKAFTYISKYGYFSFIKIDKKPFQVKFIKDFKAVLDNQTLVYEFFVPCHVTAVHTLKTITVATYDPTYYTSIFFERHEPVSLISAEPFEVEVIIREDPDTKIYFDLVHPWSLFFKFRKKS